MSFAMVESTIMEGLTALSNTILAHPMAAFGMVAGVLGLWKRAFLARLIARGRPKEKKESGPTAPSFTPPAAARGAVLRHTPPQEIISQK